MWLAASESPLRVGLAVLLVGLAIKLMDDYVDYDIDQILGTPNLSRVLGDALPVYMGFCTALATYLAPETGATLFLAAYLVGMGDELGVRYAGGWKAWMEVLAAMALGCLISYRPFILNLVLIVTVQLADDLKDREHDHRAARRTIPVLFGPKFGALLVLTLALLALAWSPGYSAWVMTSAWLLTVVSERVGTP
ncbi:MAG: hypothetical protein ACM3ZQ_03695 [Bacillota bacterium]